MTLDPEVNRYVAHFKQIRVIQDYLAMRAERHAVPRVNNTNVDRSVAAIHATVLAFLRRRHLVTHPAYNLFPCGSHFLW